MFLDIDHNVEEIERRDVARSVWIFTFKCFFGMLLMEIVQQLCKFGVGDSSRFVLIWKNKIVKIWFVLSPNSSKEYFCIRDVPFRNSVEWTVHPNGMGSFGVNRFFWWFHRIHCSWRCRCRSCRTAERPFCRERLVCTVILRMLEIQWTKSDRLYLCQQCYPINLRNPRAKVFRVAEMNNKTRTENENLTTNQTKE